jgi:CheY-like chemotaxis protein
LERTARAKDEFLASMSHELRTPLNAILTLAESLEEGIYGEMTERQLKPMRTVAESGHLLLNLINDILDLSKIEAGKMILQPAIFEIEPLCQASLRLIKQQAMKKRLMVKFTTDSNVNHINADARCFKQILVNLLSNAVKFTGDGGQIGLDVEGDRANGVVKLTVWDTGIGIAPDQTNLLFHPFVQIDSGLARQYGGSGLGLFLVYRMVEMHGGSISLESSLGKGSRFTVSLPWDEDNLEEPSEETTSYSSEDSSSSVNDNKRTTNPSTEIKRPISYRSRSHYRSSPIILIAEDSLANQTTYSDYLTAQGYRIVLASNGIEAIERTIEMKPDLVLMDIQMPGTDGLEAIKRIRTYPEYSSLPILALTALVMPGDRERCLQAGADEYITKPVSLKNLFVEIENHLQGRK